MTGFASRVLAWFDDHGRHDLPWQHPRTPYRVWLSEIMLQQTQVATATPYFLRFVDELPTLPALAAAGSDRVLALWAGLGYYARARNLHATARHCVEHHGGELPDNIDALVALPGIGRSTAGAILAQAHGQRHAILDGNVKRVLARFHGVEGWTGGVPVQRQLWAYAKSHLPDARLADYTQAQMDLGATVCTRSRPACERCPVHEECVARLQGRTAQLPTARPRAITPVRSTVMMVLRDQRGHVLLQRRPPVGIWGGLWSLPEAADVEEAEDWARTHVRGEDTRDPLPLPPFEHVFSHFKLRVQPLLFDVEPAASQIGDNDGIRWHPPADAESLGLPAPVARLLQTLQGGTDRCRE